jgi:DNA-binding GntR family transcriptional regulator
MAERLGSIDRGNLSERVYSTLCDAIIKGRFQPGDRLKIRDVAEELGTSVTPVRDAILRLTHDDALVFHSPRDIRIPVLGLDRYLEIRSIRLRLESLAAENAALYATDDDISRLENLVKRNETALGDGDVTLGLELNQSFHFELAAIGRMPVLYGTLRKIWLQMGPLVADAYVEGGRAMIDHHYPVIEALRRHDREAAAAAIMQDILDGGHCILKRAEAVSARSG